MAKVRTLRYENYSYMAIWAFLVILPVIIGLSKYITTGLFELKPIIRWWVGMCPLIVVFLVNNFVLIPRFLKKGKTFHYVVSVSALLLLFCTAAHTIDVYLRPANHVHAPHIQMHHPPVPSDVHEDAGFKDRSAPPPEVWRPVPPRHAHMPGHPRMFPMLFSLLLALLTLGVNVAVSMAFTYNRQQADKMDLENYRLQEELKYLKQQISPHFFMNVLNNIHEMTEEDVGKAQEMILELSRLMRYVLYESENGSTTLAAEARFISSYVSLMKRRYLEDVVKVSLELPQQTSGNVRIPPLLFISFIENAFKHGVSYLNETVIDIRLHETEGKVFFNCTNTVPQNKLESAGQGGVGFANVVRRLDLLYGDDYSLKIFAEEGKYSVNLLIPSI